MSEELKPVRCGCGGEAYHEAYENYNFGSYIAHIMICDKCGMRTAEWPTEAEAIQAWNKAMRRAKVDILPNTSEDKGAMPYCPHCGDELEWE